MNPMLFAGAAHLLGARIVFAGAPSVDRPQPGDTVELLRIGLAEERVRRGP